MRAGGMERSVRRSLAGFFTLLSLGMGSAAFADPPLPTERLDAGIQAQKSKDTERAIVEFEACLTTATDPELVTRCRWELGWSWWTTNNWTKVLEQWDKIEALPAGLDGLDKYRTQARQNLEDDQRIAASGTGVPASVTPKTASVLRLRAAGDIMLGTEFPPTLPPQDGALMLVGVRDLLRDADLTLVNLEGPFCDSGITTKCGEGSNCYAFRTPTRYVKYLVDSGVDFGSTANNHAGDFGDECRRTTEQTLDQAKIAWSGAPGSIGKLSSKGKKVAVIGFHTNAAVNDVNDHETAATLVKAASETHDFVVVFFHGGGEGAKAKHVPKGEEIFLGENRGDLRTFSRVVIAAGADLVLGAGPHVPRGMEIVDGHLVAYSMGNFATYGRFNLSGDLSTSLVLEVSLAADGKLSSGKILPVRQVGEGVPEVDPTGRSIDLIRLLSNEDFGANAPIIAKDGSFIPR